MCYGKLLRFIYTSCVFGDIFIEHGKILEEGSAACTIVCRGTIVPITTYCLLLSHVELIHIRLSKFASYFFEWNLIYNIQFIIFLYLTIIRENLLKQ